jgi:hypothetical protein
MLDTGILSEPDIGGCKQRLKRYCSSALRHIRLLSLTANLRSKHEDWPLMHPIHADFLHGFSGSSASVPPLNSDNSRPMACKFMDRLNRRGWCSTKDANFGSRQRCPTLPIGKNKNVNTILDVRFCLGCEFAEAANPHLYFAALVARNN